MPLIALDGCFLKTFLGGILVSAVGQDGNNEIYLIAWAIVEVENEQCWTWFLKCLIEDLRIADGAGWTFISDQHKGLTNAVNRLAPLAEHRNCARHVYMNWKKIHKELELKKLYWKAVKSTYIEKFKSAIQDMKVESRVAYEDFINRDTKKFCKAFISTSACSDIITSNIAESFNAHSVEARGKHIIHMCEKIRCDLMEQ